jgi:hypothetical protein
MTATGTDQPSPLAASKGDSIAARPTFPIAALAKPQALTVFKAVVEWAIDHVTEATGEAT